MQIVWITDPHLNHVPAHRWDVWAEQIRQCAPDALLITGDLSEGEDVAFELKRLIAAIDVPIHFVLGNHDFYDGSVSSVRREIIDLCGEAPTLSYLTNSDPVVLDGGCYLVGDDGWGDATVGNAFSTPVQLHDFHRIDDLRGLSLRRRNARLQILGQESADRLKAKLQSLPDDASQVVVAIHIPPFREACWYNGKTASDDWAPFFINGRAGDMLLKFANACPQIQTTVLCGHTHHSGTARMTDNLIVHTGHAEYAYPEIQGVITIRDGCVNVGDLQ